jgi:hypothetical protein
MLLAVPLLAQQSGGPPGMSGGGSSFGGAPQKGTGGGGGSAPKKPEPGSLEDLLDKALRNNADIRAAEAKVREAEAELNRVRHQVLAKIVGVRNDIDSAKKMLGYSERLLELARKANSSQQEVQAAIVAVDKQKAEVTKLENDLQALTGTWKTIHDLAFSPDGKLLYSAVTDGTVRIWDLQHGRLADSSSTIALLALGQSMGGGVQASMAERIKAALDKTVKMTAIPNEVPVADALAAIIQKGNIDVPFRPVGKPGAAPTTLMSAELPFGAWLQALEDSDPNIRFVVRDYGILVTTKDRIPDGAITVHDFWKRGEKGKADPSSAPPKK